MGSLNTNLTLVFSTLRGLGLENLKNFFQFFILLYVTFKPLSFTIMNIFELTDNSILTRMCYNFSVAYRYEKLIFWVLAKVFWNFQTLYALAPRVCYQIRVQRSAPSPPRGLNFRRLACLGNSRQVEKVWKVEPGLSCITGLPYSVSHFKNEIQQ